MSKFYLTTAIDYVNSRPHLGTAYEKVCADAIARYKRLSGADTYFLMGNDEHSLNVRRRALELGLDPLVYCDQMEREFRGVWDALNIRYDDFIRTSEKRHHAVVQEFVRRLAQRELGGQKALYRDWYRGWYCVSCEAYYQSEELEQQSCPIHRRPVEWIEERNLFFRLSAYRDTLLEHFERHPDFVQPEPRRNELLRLMERGLTDISISRAASDWGVPLPDDPESVVYVWFDALINYVTGAGFLSEPERFERLWPADLHVIGKDITRFHCLIWPAMLLGAGLELPRQVFAHGFISVRGEKMSKTTGNIIDPLEAIQRVGADSLRYFLLREYTFGKDGDFTWERFQDRYNADLANDLGNLVSRLATMVDKYCGGALPAAPAPEAQHPMMQAFEELPQAYKDSMERLELHQGIAHAWQLVSLSNVRIDVVKPWELARDPERREELERELVALAEALRLAALYLTPFIPASSREIWRRLGLDRDPAQTRLEHVRAYDGALSGRRIEKGAPLFPRLHEIV
ncbi:MAG TPA: methionine--tRNA ligase [Acidobacteriota bacterium]